MTQDNVKVDTPQESSNEQQYNSLEEAVFGTDMGSNDVTSAFTTGNEGTTETAPEPTGQPEVSKEEVAPQTPTQNNNDENRYQYWQSQADKYKNELEAMKSQQAQAQPAAPVEESAPVDEFPPAPE